MNIIDAQVHIWSKMVVPTSGLHRKVSTFTAEELLKEMDEAKVDAALIHPPSGWDPDANALAIEAARKYPERFAVMGQFPLDNPDNRKLIHGWRHQPGMMGLRWPLLLEAQQKWLYDGSLEWLWPAAEQEGLPIAMMGGLFLPKFREIAERHPRLKMITDHCGLNRRGQDAAAFIHLDELVALAKLPNVAVKATGAPHYSTQAYPYHPGRTASYFRRVRAKTFLLGHRHHPNALQLPSMRNLLHRGIGLAEGERAGGRHGPRVVRMDWLGLQILSNGAICRRPWPGN